ncbi:MAG: hypothetical protein ABI184_03110 [Ginsengibacter sp.]
MKKLIFILPWLIMLSCNNSSGSGNNSDAPKRDVATASSGSGADKGTMTCTIDGKSKTFQVHSGFTEIRLDPDSKGPNDGFMLLDGDKTREGFQFEIKNKGTSVFKGMDGVLNMFSYFNSKGADYVAHEDVTASVTSVDGNHLTGTFSGKFENTNYKGASDINPEFITITDGKFELNK